MTRHLYSLILIALLLLFVTACKSRGKAANNLSMTMDHVAWFVDARHPLNICVSSTPAVQNALIENNSQQALSSLRNLVGKSYFRWIKYLAAKGIQPLYESRLRRQPDTYDIDHFDSGLGHDIPLVSQLFYDRPSDESLASAFPDLLTFTSECASADLEIHFGTTSQSMIHNKHTEPETILGTADLIRQTTESLRGRGVIHIADHSSKLSYKDLSEPRAVLIHEFGHVFGVPHVPGTIMDPNEIGKFMNVATALRKFPFAHERKLITSDFIDLWRELVLCQGECNVEGVFLNRVYSEAMIHRNRGTESIKVGMQSKLKMHFPMNTSDRINVFNDADSDFPPNFSEPTPQVHISKSGKSRTVNIENSENIIEVFKRPQFLNAPVIYHQSLVFIEWMNSKFFLKTSFNANAEDTSPMQIFANCKGQPTHDLFLSRFIRHGAGFDPTPPSIENNYFLERFHHIANACQNQDDEFFNLSHFELSETEKDIVTKNAQATFDPNLWHPVLKVTPTTERPLFCAPFTDSVKLCLWYDSGVARLEFTEGDKGATCYLEPLQYGRIIAGQGNFWQCRIQTSKAQWLIQIELPLNINPNATSIEYKLGTIRDFYILHAEKTGTLLRIDENSAP